MIGYVKGIVTYMFADSCFVDVQGVGYKVYAPLSSLGKVTIGQEALFFTYMAVREDAITLYGFLTQDEYDLFLLLTGVKGIGPKAALGILSAVDPNGFRAAIRQKNMAVLTNIPGIGKKSAERMVVELQDKIGKASAGEDVAAIAGGVMTAPKGIAQEAMAALTSLGYASAEVEPVIEEKAPHCDTVEALLKEVLRSLGSGR